MDEQLSIVIIEWDGGRPPTTWYNRLEKFGYSIRGNKDQSPLARRKNRISEEYGVVAQEGALICSSQSEARTLGALARDLGAKSVMVGYMDLTDLEMTNEDALVMERIQSTLGKRGRPEAEKVYTVTCHDEMRTYRHQGRTPVHCTHCGSFKISSREGEPNHVPFHGESLDAFWTASRFIIGYFEEPVLDAAALPLNGPTAPIAPSDTKRTKILTHSKLMAQIQDLYNQNVINVEQALHLLDLGLQNIENAPAVRQTKRLAALTRYFERGGLNTGIELVVNPDGVDLYDICSDREALNLALR